MNQRNHENLANARVAFIQACWHKDIVDQCRLSFMAHIGEHGIDPNNVDVFEVPGVFEIPLQVKLLAQSRRYDAVVATGFIVDGGIYRHEFVSTAVIDALMQLQLELEVPVVSAVLTPQRFHEHADHQNFFREHFVVKGAEAAAACAGAIAGVRQIHALTHAPQRAAG